ncbi:MAG: UDP-N-acetylmuramoyl-L-alanyl-D-glutamate--2,6-diaminopimelate ligase [Anaerolineae bacterium]|nr:UDP-N-acetylmuramoyl-L-alanyl-D-glutamate--2,6-diaminopimelate ligase [Anaerolineae bacterium]
MLFSTLLQALDDVISSPTTDANVSAPVTEDNRTLQRGGLFVARQGKSFDGHTLIRTAVEQGAVAVVGERPPDQVECPVPYAQVGSAMFATGRLAAAYHGYPSRSLVVIGVTGTDGKTTTSTLLFNILKAAGYKVGMISTVSAVIGDEELPTGLHVTTPGADEIQGYLRRMVSAGLTHCVLETTSHGLAQARVNGVDYDVAVITNITHEHLDYHGTFEHYREAKGLLFASLSTSYRKPMVGKFAVVNRDDPNADFFLGFPADQHLTYSTRTEATVTTSDKSLVFSPTATKFKVKAWDQRFTITTSLVGRYNVENILAATTAALGLDVDAAAIKKGVKALKGIPGRMERIDEGQSFIALVDFAHTPNALKRSLEAARQMLPPDKRLIAVFGSAGLRDREKRRLMAETSAQLADITILTAEDPRTESLDDILQTMADGAASQGGVEGKTFLRVTDRGEALFTACGMAHPGDVVIACGKGHEQSMAFGTVEYPWDDREALRAALRGHPLKTLPTASPSDGR